MIEQATLIYRDTRTSPLQDPPGRCHRGTWSDYGIGAQILSDLGIRRMRLITNNPAKYGGLDGYGLEIVGRVSLPTIETPHNIRYLRTKRDRMGHHLTITASPVTQP